MRPDGRLERFDEVIKFLYKEEIGPQGTMHQTPKQKRELSVDVDEAMGYLDELMVYNQAHHYAREPDPFMVRFPWALPLYVSQEFKCIDTNAVFEVEWVEEKVKRAHGVRKLWKTGRAKLKGPHVPYERYHLVPMVKDQVRFFKGQPTNLADTYVFDEATIQQVRKTAAFSDTITCMVTDRMPAAQDKQPFGNNKQLKPQFKEYVQKTNDPTQQVRVMSQMFDNIVQFSVWSRTNARADIVLTWFEDFMARYAWVLKWNGVQEVFYWQRTRDTKVTRWRDDIVERTVEYYFRTAKVTAFNERLITSLSIEVDTLTQGEGVDALFGDSTSPLDWPNPATGLIPAHIIDGTGTAIIQY